jgi:purine-nucleoside phosphorylase
MSHPTLDESVYSASKELRGRGAPDPEVLFLMATGVGLLPSSFEVTWKLPLGNIAGVPHAWRGQELIASERREATYWFLEDAPGESGFPSTGGTSLIDAPWISAFPAWLAACSGASLCVHTSAGSLLGEHENANAMQLGLVSDHINLSGRTPLFGLGDSRVGPIFPDQSRVHNESLRKTALALAKKLGIGAMEGVAACTAGPALETPAEQDFYSRVGADFAVQNLASPLIAMSHAGLSCLSVVALLNDSDSGSPSAGEVRDILNRAETLAPAMEELLVALGPELSKLSFELREEV